MFPTLYHFIKDIFGLELRFLEVVNTFGFFVALSIAAAYWAMQTEFRRKTKMGLFSTRTETTEIGHPFPMSDYIIGAIISFIFGYKILYLMVNSGNGFVPQEHIFTSEGSFLWGMIALIFSVTTKLYADKKQRLEVVKKVEQQVSIADEMGNITTVALVSGFLGAKIFHLLETPSQIHWDTFFSDLLTTGGWTFYGGLICGAAGVLIYTTKKGYNWKHVIDAGGPAMMLSYGIGRFGCHFSGDGDWGIANTRQSSFLPDWAWAYKYPHNVLGKDYPGMGMEPIPGCTGDYCFQLSTPVYPTPLYEAIMALGLFALLWFWLRNKSFNPGQFFGIYMVFAGVERFLIETIREHGDSLYRFSGMVFSQAQMISLLLIVLGTCGYFIFNKHQHSSPTT